MHANYMVLKLFFKLYFHDKAVKRDDRSLHKKKLYMCNSLICTKKGMYF